MAVTDDDDSIEREVAAALDDFGDAVNRDEFFEE
jgi:hypothetical protein